MKNCLVLSVAALTISVAPFSAHAQDAKTLAAKSAEMPGFGAVDANNDGIVTKAEADAASNNEFKIFDTNKDGKISRDEFLEAVYNINKIPDEATKKKAEPQAIQRFKALDADGNGELSKAEFTSVSTRKFEIMDENHDGKVTKEEAEDIQKKVKAQIEAMRAAAAAAQQKSGAQAPAATSPAK